ncbi:MAG: phosphopantetheine-binding protein [Bacteroidia bacterium]|nr:phosphopantetheine-binding protein [Bacteroidia bacterium]
MDDLKTFIQQEIAQLAFKKVAFDESLIRSNLLDSITVVDLVISIEEKTGKRIPQHLITEENMDTINQIAALTETL